MKKFSFRLFGLAAAVLVVFANIASASACTFGHYQPEVPKSLRK